MKATKEESSFGFKTAKEVMEKKFKKELSQDMLDSIEETLQNLHENTDTSHRNEDVLTISKCIVQENEDNLQENDDNYQGNMRLKVDNLRDETDSFQEGADCLPREAGDLEETTESFKEISGKFERSKEIDVKEVKKVAEKLEALFGDDVNESPNYNENLKNEYKEFETFVKNESKTQSGAESESSRSKKRKHEDKRSATSSRKKPRIIIKEDDLKLNLKSERDCNIENKRDVTKDKRTISKRSENMFKEKGIDLRQKDDAIKQKQDSSRCKVDVSKQDASKNKLGKVKIGSLVVKLLAPAYAENRFDSKETFKSLARNITHFLHDKGKIINFSCVLTNNIYFIDETEIKRYVTNFLRTNREITSATLIS